MRALISARHSPMHSSALPWQLARGKNGIVLTLGQATAPMSPRHGNGAPWGSKPRPTRPARRARCLPAPPLQTSTRSAHELLPHARGNKNKSLPSAGSSLATQLQGNFPSP